MKSLSNLITLLVIAALTLLAGPTSAATWYVDGTASGNGTSWAQGFETIAEAIADANAPDEIWVKAGTYTISSQMLVDEAIGIYGGFAGSETERSQRDWATNTTTIDGQDNTRILKIKNETIIDGFILTNGYYDASSTFSGGGAISFGPGAGDTRISNCIISNNTVYSNSIGPEGIKGGGAIYVGTGSPLFVNCLITNNSTNTYGGGINIYSGSPDFVNCTISKNTALKGGGLCVQGGGGGYPVVDAEFYNCIVWGNNGTIDANDLFVRIDGDLPRGSNNCSSVQIGSGTILADPLFIDPNDFHLQAGSPCIDAGDSNSVPADITNDLDGGPRFINGTYADESPLPHVDIGAYEFGKLHCGNGDLPYPTGDINLDCGVDLIDSAMFIWCWLTNAGEPGWDPNCNLYDADLTIDMYDLDVLGENWLTFAFLPLVTVPDVVDTAQASAEAAITAAGLVVGSVTTSYDPVIITDNVISQDPASGSFVLPDTAVDFVVSLGPEPVGHWTMDDDANNMTVLDSSSNGNHGTAWQNTEYMSTLGIIDGALSFDGSNDYVDCGDGSGLDFGTGDFSISMWIKTSSGSPMRLVNKRDASNIGYEITTNASGLLRAGIGDSSGYTEALGGSINDNAWHHVAITYDRGGNVSLYVDAGTPSTTDISSYSGSLDNSEPFKIGRYRTAASYFQGAIDDVKLFNRVLSDEDIAALYSE